MIKFCFLWIRAAEFDWRMGRAWAPQTSGNHVEGITATGRVCAAAAVSAGLCGRPYLVLEIGAVVSGW